MSGEFTVFRNIAKCSKLLNAYQYSEGPVESVFYYDDRSFLWKVSTNLPHYLA